MKFIDLETQYQRIKPKLDASLAELFIRQDFILGKDVDELEARLCEFTGRKHCISCSNGTDALSMPLMLLKIGKGDAVFLPTFTFFATAESVALRGATPVLVDSDERTFNIDVKKLEEAIIRVKKEGKLTPKMIIPVDLFGLCCDYAPITALASKYGLYVMEDGAQGFGAKYHGRAACSFGDFSTTSFFPAKPLGCYGDGGAIFTDSDEWASDLKALRVHGKGKNKYENNSLGLNARLDTIQAAVLNKKLDIFKDEIRARNQAARLYGEMLSDKLTKPFIPDGLESVYAQYTVILPKEASRDKIMSALKVQNIPTMVYYERPMHLQKALDFLYHKEGDFPIAEDLASRVLSLPMHPYLTEENIKTVTTQLNALL